MKDEKEPEKLTEYIDRTYGMLEEAVQSIREISNNLSPAILSKYGIVEAIQAFIEKLNLVSKIDFTIQSSLKFRFPEIIEFTIYRVIIELINNSIKYAKAQKINININYVIDNIEIQYFDDGQGFEYEKIKMRKLGFGLINLESRIRKLGGKYEYFSSPGKGIKVNIKIQTNYL
jgi:signal transduction histidine kinase